MPLRCPPRRSRLAATTLALIAAFAPSGGCARFGFDDGPDGGAKDAAGSADRGLKDGAASVDAGSDGAAARDVTYADAVSVRDAPRPHDVGVGNDAPVPVDHGVIKPDAGPVVKCAPPLSVRSTERGFDIAAIGGSLAVLYVDDQNVTQKGLAYRVSVASGAWQTQAAPTLPRPADAAGFVVLAVSRKPAAARLHALVSQLSASYYVTTQASAPTPSWSQASVVGTGGKAVHGAALAATDSGVFGVFSVTELSGRRWRRRFVASSGSVSACPIEVITAEPQALSLAVNSTYLLQIETAGVATKAIVYAAAAPCGAAKESFTLALNEGEGLNAAATGPAGAMTALATSKVAGVRTLHSATYVPQTTIFKVTPAKSLRTSLAAAFDGKGRLHVVYRDGSGRVTYNHRDQSGWLAQTLQKSGSAAPGRLRLALTDTHLYVLARDDGVTALYCVAL